MVAKGVDKSNAALASCCRPPDDGGMPDLSPLETAEILRRMRCRYAAANVVRSYRYARPEHVSSAEVVMAEALTQMRRDPANRSRKQINMKKLTIAFAAFTTMPLMAMAQEQPIVCSFKPSEPFIFDNGGTITYAHEHAIMKYVGAEPSIHLTCRDFVCVTSETGEDGTTWKKIITHSPGHDWLVSTVLTYFRALKENDSIEIVRWHKASCE